MSDLLSGSITFTGLGSGTDFTSIIDGLIQVASVQKNRMESWKTDWEDKVEASQELNSAMLSLQTTLESMDTMNEFLARTATSADENILGASADADAEVGIHEIEVEQLAQNKIMTNKTGYASEDAEVNSSGASQDLVINYAGNDPFTVSVSNGTTLEGLANLINNDPNNPGVRASVITNGEEYFLQLRGMDMGDEATLDTLGSTLDGYDPNPVNWDINQVNQNSQIKVDGWPTISTDWIENDSNTITDIIEGVTLTLRDTGTVQMGIETDTEVVKENVRTFVEQVNAVRTLITELTRFDSVSVTGSVSAQGLTDPDDQTEGGSVMTGNYAVQLVSSMLKSATAAQGKGFSYYDASGSVAVGDTFSSLSQIGILTDAQEGSVTNGLLILDEEALDAALAEDATCVAELFAADFQGDQSVSSGNFNYYNHISSVTEPGSYDVSYTVDGSSVTSATIDGETASITQEDGAYYIVSTSGNSRGLRIKVTDLTTNGSGQVQLKQGKTGEIRDLLEDLTNSESGPLAILEENYGDIIDNIDQKIEREETRLAKMKMNLTEKYARLEALLGTYNNTSTTLSNQISQLDNS